MIENVNILVAILKSKGFHIVAASNGYEALELAQQESFDLILLDIMMPDISGLEVCRYLKIDPKTSKIPVIFLTASSDKSILKKAFAVGGVDYIEKPYFKDELLARVDSALKLHYYSQNLENEVKRRTRELEDAQVHLMRMLGGIAEGHSVETYQHVRRVAEFTELMARKCGLDEKEVKTLKYASYLHDIGKIGVKDYILHKKGKLTKEEFEEIKKHPKLGAAMLEGVHLPLFETARIVAKEHHEKWDGSGYPDGLKGEEIHIYARIVAVADVFDALASPRSYKEGWNINDTLDFFQQMRGSHFDPRLIDLLFDNLDQFLALYGIDPTKTNKVPVAQKGKRNILDWLLSKI